MKKKILSILLALSLCLSLLPTAVFAAEGDETPPDSGSTSDCTYDSNGFCTNPEHIDCYQPAPLADDNYYEISNAGQLYWFAKKVNDTKSTLENRTVINGRLKENITVNSGTFIPAVDEEGNEIVKYTENGEEAEPRSWKPIGTDLIVNFSSNEEYNIYTGTFDGGNHTVSGLYYYDIEGGGANVGLFGTVYDATVKNVSLKNSYFGCKVTGTNNTSDILVNVGGIVGMSRSTTSGSIEGCTVDSTMFCTQVNVSATVSVGGIVGRSSEALTLKDCSTGDAVTFRDSLSGSDKIALVVGGIVGHIAATSSHTVTVESCHNSSAVSGTASAGGIVGYIAADTTDTTDATATVTVKSCHNNGTVSATANTTTTSIDVESNATATANANAGGIVGCIATSFAMVTVKSCHNNGTVSANATANATAKKKGTANANANAGGIVGYITTTNATVTVESCHNNGAVSGTANAYAYAESATATANANANAGGIVGCIATSSAMVTVKSCHNNGAVSATANANAESGTANANAESGTANANAGGIAGGITTSATAEVTAADCFYLKADGLEDAFESGTTGKTAAQFASGEVCYLLNGSTSEGTENAPLMWYQTLNTDTAPVLDSTHKTVYAISDSAHYTNTKDGAPVHVYSAGSTTCVVEGCDETICTHTLGADGNCGACNQPIVAETIIDGTTSYDISLDGIGTKINGKTATVNLLANASGDIFVGADTNLTLDLKGKTLTGGLTVSGGSVTVDANGGKITGTVDLINGHLTLNGGTYEGNLTMSDGNLTITDGTFNKTVDLGSAGTARLTGGTFTKLNAGEGKDLKTYLAVNYAFVEAENPSKGVPNPGNEVSNVKVIAHYEHTVANGSCTICGKSLVASITAGGKTQYFETLEAALENAAEGQTLTLENGIELTQDISLSGKSITLDLNGKKIQGTDNINVASGATLTLKGTEGSEIAVPINVNGTLKVAEAVVLQGVSVTGHIAVDADAKFVSLSITGGTATLNSGTFATLSVATGETLSDKIEQDRITLGTDKALCSGSTWYTGDGLKVHSLSDVSVKTIPIKSVSISTDGNKASFAYGEDVTLTATASLAAGYSESNVSYAWENAGGNGEGLGSTKTITRENLAPKNYNIKCTVTVDGYSLSNYIEFTVNKATLTGKYTAPTAKADLIYDSNKDQVLINAGSFTTGISGPTFQYGMKDANGAMGWGDASGKTGRDAGTYTVYWYIKGDDNYESVGSVQNPAGSVEVTIAPKTVTPTVDAISAQIYTGSAITPDVTVKVDDKTLTKDADYTVSYENNINAGTDTAKAIVAAKDGSNYTWAQPVTKTFTITKASAQTLDDITVNRKYTATDEQSTQIGSIMPDDAGTLSYSVGTPNVKGTATVSSFTVSDSGLVKYTITDGAAGDKITLPVKINSTNYEESTVNVVVTLTEKDTQAALNITSATAVTYGQTLTLSTSGGSGTGDVSYEVVGGGTGEATISGSTLTATKAGTVKVKATKAADDDYASVESTVIEITVNKATPTGTPKYTAISTSGKTLADANLTTTDATFSVPGSVKWVDADGNDLADTTEVAANTAYKWLFTPDDTVNYTTLTGSITLYPVSSGGGGGGGGSKPTTPSTPSTSVTVPVTSDTASVEVKAEVSKDGTAKVEVSDKQIEEVASNGSGTVTVDVSGVKDVESVQVPSHVVETTNKAEETGLTVTMPTGSVALDETALDSVSKGEDVTVSVKRVPATDLNEAQQAAVGDMANIGIVVDVDVFVGSEKQSNFNGGKLTISVPYTPKKNEDPSKMTVWYIKDDGTIQPMGGSYDAEKKCFVFETTHLSRYVIVSVEDMPTFTDVPEDAYYSDAVTWAVLNGITTGMTETTFGPDLSCTRAQIVTFLWRAAGQPEVTGSNPFSDVNESDYFYQAVLWAVENKITTGTTATTFAPEDTCTRAQAAAFLYRNEQANGGGFTDAWAFQLPFTDVPDWCYEAVAWCYMNGVTQGTSATTFSPDLDCSRAQIVTMLYRVDLL